MGLRKGPKFKAIGIDGHAIYSNTFFNFISMDLVIDKELVFFDIETTGLSIAKDRIIQIAMIKFFPSPKGSNVGPKPIMKKRLVNPTEEGIYLMQQPNTAPHNIKWQDLEAEPTFKKIAKSMRSFLGKADLGGHNIRNFDIPMLREEFLRCGISDWPDPNARLVDTFMLFTKLIPRSLSGAVSFFTNQNMNENAHDAEYDINMTVQVLDGMLNYAPGMGNTTEELHDFAKPDAKAVDWSGVLVVDSKSDVVFARGKHKGKRVVDHPGYCKYIMANPYSQDTKNAIIETFKIYKRDFP